MKLSSRQRTALARALANAFTNDEFARLSGATLPAGDDRVALLETAITGLEERQALHTFISAAKTHRLDDPRLQDILEEADVVAAPSRHAAQAEALLALIRTHEVAEGIVSLGYVMFRPEPLKEAGELADPIVHGVKWFADALVRDVATHPLLLLGKYLSMHADIPLFVRRRFKAWLTTATNAFGYDVDVSALGEAVAARTAEFKDARLHLLIAIGEWEPEKLGVRAWWQLLGKKDVLLDHSPPSHLVPYEPSTFASLVMRLIIDVTDIRSAVGGEMTIEFFLPDELLLDLRVDHLRYEPPAGSPSVLGAEFPVMVRSFDRAFAGNDEHGRVLTADWRRHWGWYRGRPRVYACPTLIEEDRYAGAVKEDECSQVILGFVPSRRLCSMMIETGTPIAVWPQREIQRYGELEATLKEKKPDDWRRRVHTLRRKAANVKPPEKPDDHYGHHLCLLWDDPWRVPPRNVFQEPRGPLT